MANVFTTTTTLTLLIEKALNREADWALRESPTFRQMVDKQTGILTNPGQPVKMVIMNDLALATTELTENVDPDSVAIPAPTVITVTPKEYGNATLRTLKMQELTFTNNVISDIAMTVGRNMIDSVDNLYQAVFDTGANVMSREGGVYKTTVTLNSILVADVLNADGAARAAAMLRTRLAAPRTDGLMHAIVHPNVAYDLKRESGASANTVNSWFYAHANGGDLGAIYRGEIGTFVGIRWVENAKATKVTNSVPASVYNTYIMGREPLVEHVVIEPKIVVGEVTDKLRRFYPVGWYGMLNMALYRSESLQIVRTSATLQ